MPRILPVQVTAGYSKYSYIQASRQEAARPSTTGRQLSPCPRIDAGRAANTVQDLSPALGYGLGVRWRSPVGPLRVDLAYGQELHKVRLHLSVGIAF